MKLDRIYTRGGDSGLTSLGDGARVTKFDVRMEAMGAVDEANAAIGIAVLQIMDSDARDILTRVQNDLFDVGADLCRPEAEGVTALRVSAQQVAQLENFIDRYNADLNVLTSFVLPGGSAASAYLHLARTIVRRAERRVALLASEQTLNKEALKYLNRLSDFLFVLARFENGLGKNDVLWTPGKNR